MTAAAFDEPRRPARWGHAMGAVRRSLDFLYDAAGYLAAACLAGILVLTLAQIVTRYLGIPVRGLTDYAGYVMAASSFLAFAHALNHGAHVRISMVLTALGPYRRLGEIAALGVATAGAAWFAYYSCNMVYWSWMYGDISTGLDATPLWIPQSTMAVGTVLFAVALADNFLTLLFTGHDNIAQSSGGH